MKTISLFFLLFCLVTSLLAKDPYFCPMYCEGKKTYEQPGSCPICKMYLERETEEDKSLISIDYRVELKAETVQVGKPAQIQLILRRSQEGGAPVKLVGEDNIRLAVDVMPQDLSSIDSERAERSSEGIYTLKKQFEKGGNYLLFVHFTPEGDKFQVIPLALQVQPARTSTFNLREQLGSDQRAGKLKVHLKIFPKARANHASHFKFSLRGSKAELKKLVGKPRVVVISEDTTWYFESREAFKNTKDGCESEFFVRLPKAGAYRIWFEYQEGVAPLGYGVLAKE